MLFEHADMDPRKLVGSGKMTIGRDEASLNHVAHRARDLT